MPSSFISCTSTLPIISRGDIPTNTTPRRTYRYGPMQCCSRPRQSLVATAGRGGQEWWDVSVNAIVIRQLYLHPPHHLTRRHTHKYHTMSHVPPKPTAIDSLPATVPILFLSATPSIPSLSSKKTTPPSMNISMESPAHSPTCSFGLPAVHPGVTYLMLFETLCVPITEGKSPAKRAREHTREIFRERMVFVGAGCWVVEKEDEACAGGGGRGNEGVVRTVVIVQGLAGVCFSAGRRAREGHIN